MAAWLLNRMRDHRWAGLMWGLLLAAVLGLPSCVGEDPFGGTIVSMTVNPSTIPEDDTKVSTPVEVEITVAGLEGQIVEADAFIQLEGNERVAQKSSFSVQGSTIVLEGIDTTWFTNLAPSDYQIGATVVTDTPETLQQLDLTTVSIVQ